MVVTLTSFGVSLGIVGSGDEHADYGSDDLRSVGRVCPFGGFKLLDESAEDFGGDGGVFRDSGVQGGIVGEGEVGGFQPVFYFGEGDEGHVKYRGDQGGGLPDPQSLLQLTVSGVTTPALTN